MKEFVKALTTAKKVIGKNKKTMPILACVRIEQKGNALVIQATDMEIIYTARVDIGCIPELPQPVAVECDMLLKILKGAKKIDTFRSDGNTLVVNQAKIFTLPVEEMPVFPVFPPSDVKLKIVKFNPEALLWVKKAMADDKEMRHSLQGVFFDTQAVDISGEMVGNMVATDGHRMHLSPLESRARNAKSAIVPGKVVDLMAGMKGAELYLSIICKTCNGNGKKPFSLLTSEEREQFTKELSEYATSIYDRIEAYKGISPFKDINGGTKDIYSLDDAEMEIVSQEYLKTLTLEKYYNEKSIQPKCEDCKESGLEKGQGYCVVVAGNETLQFKPLEGKFPDYNQVIPTGYTERLTVNSADLMAAIDQTAALRKKDNGVILKLNGSCSLIAENVDVGKMEISFKGDYTGAEEFTIRVNAEFLKDALGSQVSDVYFRKVINSSGKVIIDYYSPVKIEGESHAVAVVMPMRK